MLVGHNPTHCFHRSITRSFNDLLWGVSFPCAIGVPYPIGNFILHEVRNARTTIICPDSFPIEAFVRLCVRPCGHQNNAETIAALYATVGGNVVHGFDSSWAFSVIGSHRCWCGCHHQDQAHTDLFGSRPYFLRSYQKILLINYY